MRYIEDFKENDTIIEHYFCKEKNQLKTKAGKTYLSLKLVDKTGSIDGKVWEMNNDIQSFESGDFIKVKGIVLAYQNELQLRISAIRKSSEGEYVPQDYTPTTEKNIDSLVERFNSFIASLDNPKLRTLVENIVFKNPTISQCLRSHSAGKQLHHSYSGGLLEHSISVTELCDFLSSRYKYVNRDILITSALLHDMGKVFELSPHPENEYTDIGQLMGHISIMSELVGKEAEKIPDFPKKSELLIKHCLLSHHGEYEYGSPKLPMIIEAMILHVADNGDARIKMFEEALEKDKTQNDWVGFQKSLNRNIRKSGNDVQ